MGPYDTWLKLKNHNYIFTLNDLCHRDFLKFPEVRKNGEFQRRENVYGNGMRQAVTTFVDSPLSKENAIRRYGIDPDRIRIMPFLPAISIQEASHQTIPCLKDKYNIQNNYLYYPAQLWAHKNHLYILKGLKILKEKHNIIIDAVFTGSNHGNLDYLSQKAQEYGINNQVHLLGFVPNEDIPSLYKHALALVMPTYFGPTNIPPLEAFAMGTPVLYSDLPGLRDQVKDAALLMNLNDSNSLAEHTLKLINKNPIISENIKKGTQIIQQWTAHDFWLKLNEVFDRYHQLRQLWS